MYPKIQYNETLTIFTPVKNNKNEVRYAQKVLRRCWWDDKRGKVHIPLLHNPGYIPKSSGVLPDNGTWTARAGGDFDRSIIFRGNINYTPIENWQSAEDLEKHFQDFRHELMGGFFGASGVYREYCVSETEEIFYGLKMMHRLCVKIY